MDIKDKEQHEKNKKKLRIIGITLICVGAVCAVIGLADFFIAMNSDSMEMPKLFFMAFLGLPMLFTGVALTVFSYKREISTYMKNESVPVINEMGEEIAPAVTAITDAVVDGLNNDEDVVCSDCGTHNDKGSKFCKNCGKDLSHLCPNCGKPLDDNSKFCNNCGAKVE